MQWRSLKFHKCTNPHRECENERPSPIPSLVVLPLFRIVLLRIPHTYCSPFVLAVTANHVSSLRRADHPRASQPGTLCPNVSPNDRHVQQASRRYTDHPSYHVNRYRTTPVSGPCTTVRKWVGQEVLDTYATRPSSGGSKVTTPILYIPQHSNTHGFGRDIRYFGNCFAFSLLLSTWLPSCLTLCSCFL